MHFQKLRVIPPSSKAAMNEAEYVLCRWKKRLWPAKVLSRSSDSRDAATILWIEILDQNEQVKVHYTDVEPLKKESIEGIASKLDQKSHEVIEELIYRGALRKALDILHEDTSSKERSLSEMGRNKVAAWKEARESSSSMHVAHHLPPSQNDTQEIECTQNKSRLRSKAKAKSPVSQSRALLGNGELEGQLHCVSKMAATANKNVRLKTLPRPSASRRSPRLSKGDERYHQDKPRRGRSFPSFTSTCFAKRSTPARSSRNCAKTAPDKKPGVKLGVSRNLLGSLVNCPSAEVIEDLSEKEEFLPRKYNEYMNGQMQPQDSKGTCQKPTPVVASLGQERKCANHHESSTCSIDPVGPDLDCIQEESLHLYGDEAENSQLCDLEERGLGSPTDPELSPIRESCLSSALGDEEATEDEEELPSILLYQEPCSMEAGMLVWCKLPRYPYWPAVVKNVKRKAKKASVLFIEKSMDDKKSKGFSVSLRNLKHFDCEEKHMLIDKARESWQDEINWCLNLIADYRIRVGCHSFMGTLLEYCADDMSYPIRKQTHQNLSQINFPQKRKRNSEEPPSEEEEDPEEPLPKVIPRKPAKKILPDRTRAARDKANKKIVEFIVKAKGADEHLQAILKSKKQSWWLQEFLNAPPYLTCIETYLEDDDQQDLVVKYLQEVYQTVDTPLLTGSNGDSVKFILDVLFPEAIIYAISAVDQIDYKKAEEKYKRGPLLSHRERERFEEEILQKKRHLQERLS